MSGHPGSDARGVKEVKEVKEQAARNFDLVAGGYDGIDEIFSAPVAARLIEAAGIGPGHQVLDVGCGTGAALLPAAAAVVPGGRVTGVDLYQQMLDRAAARAHSAGLGNLQLVVGDAEDPPDPPCADGSYDAVISSLVIYLLPRPEQAARRWLQLLRPGGTVAFSWQVAEDPAWAPALNAADSYVPDGFPKFGQMLRHWPFMSVQETEDMLADCGYTGISTVTEDLPMRHTSPGTWWESGWVRARRISWQHIPESQRPAARAEVLGLLDPLRDPADGTVTRVPRYGWTIAHRPPPS